MIAAGLFFVLGVFSSVVFAIVYLLSTLLSVAGFAGANHLKGVEEKCTFCIHRVEKGLLPACVVNCPSFALNFGDLDDPDSNVSKLLEEKPSFRLEEEFNTQPRVYYVGRPHPSTEVRQIDTIKARE